MCVGSNAQLHKDLEILFLSEQTMALASKYHAKVSKVKECIGATLKGVGARSTTISNAFPDKQSKSTII